MRIIDKINVSNRGVEFIEHLLLRFDTSKLKRITISNTNTLFFPAKGFCYRGAYRKRNYYMILLKININEAIYPCKWLHYGKVKSDNKRGYKFIKKYFLYRNLEEAFLQTLLHEIFHYLCWTRQIHIRNNEANANEWASKRLNEFRKYYKLTTKTVKQNGNESNYKNRQAA